MVAVQKSHWCYCQVSTIRGEGNKQRRQVTPPNRNDINDPGCPIFIRRDHCVVSLSTGNSAICLGRSSDFPSTSATFPPDLLSVFIPKKFRVIQKNT